MNLGPVKPSAPKLLKLIKRTTYVLRWNKKALTELVVRRIERVCFCEIDICYPAAQGRGSRVLSQYCLSVCVSAITGKPLFRNWCNLAGMRHDAL